MTGWFEGKYNITAEHTGTPDPNVGSGPAVPRPVSPIALDMDRSGAIETTSLATSHTYFDIDNDMFAERVQWISPGDGWLSLDRNGNGKIDNQAELFGDNGGTTAYSKLAALDSNHDSKITSADTAFAQLRVWMDANSDGVSQASELKTLLSLGITSLGLESSAGSLTSTFVRSGVMYNARDIFLDTDQRDSWYQGSASEINPAALTLPHSRGYGDVKSMEYAASSDAALFNQVQQLDNVTTSGLDGYYARFEAMIEEWAGASNVVRTSNPYVDARHVAIVETFAGVNGVDVSSYTDVKNTVTGYSALLDGLLPRFIAQGTLAPVFGNPTYSFTDDAMHFTLSYSQILANAKAGVPTDTTDKKVYWSEIERTLVSYSAGFGVTAATLQGAVDTAAGYHVEVNHPWNVYIAGGTGNDSLKGSSADNFIEAGAGADTVSGGLGNDTINGGAGNDMLHGNDGNDHLSDADGANAIYGDGGNDTIEGGSGASKLYGGAGNDYVLGGGAAETISGGDGDDRLYSGGGNDSIAADAGNDQLYGGAGNSTLSGGLGADTLSGGAGTDTFRYANGDGDDMITKAATATTTDVLILTNIAHTGVTFTAVADSTASNEPNSVKINVTGGGSILLDKFLDGTNPGQIASVHFNDGVTMTAAQIVQAAAYVGTSGNDTILGGSGHDVLLGFDGADNLSGGLGNDTIYGQAGNDTIYGGTGNDVLAGGEVSDTYHYVRGDGDDTIADIGSGTQDILIFDTIARSEVSFSAIDRDANGTADSVKLTIAGGGSITLQDQIYLSTYYTIDSVKFSDGVTMTAQQIKDALPALPKVGTAGNDKLFGDSGNNTISGAAGNDQLIGNGGDDSLSGDTGNDTIWGDNGNDTILGGDNADQLIGDNGDASSVGGNDSIDAGADNDTIWGEGGNDTINGGAGKDQMTGGAGADMFLFSSVADSQAAAPDYIWDFNHGVDKLNVHGLGFAHLDTDGGLTETGELRFSAAGGITTVTSDQTGFTFQLNGTFNAATLTESDFIW